MLQGNCTKVSPLACCACPRSADNSVMNGSLYGEDENHYEEINDDFIEASEMRDGYVLDLVCDTDVETEEWLQFLLLTFEIWNTGN